MKKLLILGANPETIRLVNTAKAMGIYTIVTDPDPNAPAKKVADKGININGMDVDGLVEFCLEEKVDGVLVGIADRLIQPYQQVCERLNLPCYGNQMSCDYLTNKGKFNEILPNHNLSGIPSHKLYKNQYPLFPWTRLTFPVFIKPIDKNSGQGMSVAYNHDELSEGISKAFNSTNSEYILLEEYMDCDDVMLNFTIIEGKVFLSAMTDRYTCKMQKNVSKVCLGAKYQSKFLSLYMNDDHKNMCALLESLEVQNAIFTISAFVKNNKFHYYDPGFRLQGEAPDLHIHNVTGFDQKEFLINNALGIRNQQIYNPFNKFNATIWILLKSGIINEIEIFKEDPSIFYVSQRFNSGDIITDEMLGTERQVAARIYITCNSEIELKNKIDEIQSKTKVLDINNSNQILDRFIYE
jgi:biotin carboxylase